MKYNEDDNKPEFNEEVMIMTNRDLQRSVIVYFVGRVVGNVVPFKLDR